MSKTLQRYEKAEVKAAAALFKAAEALDELIRMARDADLPVRGADDSRITLASSNREYAYFLQDRIDARGQR